MVIIKVLSLFSGVGAFERALTNIGIDYELVGFSEIDKWAIESYSAIHDVSTDKNLGDVSEIAEENLPDADLITYGFPCQDVSVAGLGAGIAEGTRSGLLYEAERIINHVKPKYAIAENVKNLIGKRHREDFDKLLLRLEGYGYNNYWKVLNAKDFGIPQNRERVFIVSIRKDVDDGSFEFPQGFDSGLRLKDMLLDEVEDKYYIENEKTQELLSKLEEQVGVNVSQQGKEVDGITDTAHTLLARDYKGFDNQSMTAVAEPNELKLHKNLSGGKWDRVHESARRVYDEKGVAPAMHTCGGGNTEPKVAVREATEKGYDVATVGDSINVSFPNSKTRRGRVGKGVAQTLETQSTQAIIEPNEIERIGNIYPSGGQNGVIYTDKGISPTLRSGEGRVAGTGIGSNNSPKVATNYRIRKLTPQETWRLMGFTDEDYWTARRRLEEKFYNGRDRSNSQMYKQAGNSIVVDVLEHLFKNLLGG